MYADIILSFILGVLLFIALKAEIINEMTHQIYNILVSKEDREL